MSPRLSHALFGLAALAAALALLAPAGQGAALAGLSAGALALALWRRIAAQRLRVRLDADPPPLARLDEAMRAELDARVRHAAARAACREAALDGVARLLRAELGLQGVRVFAVCTLDASEARLAELIDAAAGVHAAQRRVRLDAPPHGPALRSGRRSGDARDVLALPLPAGGPPQALIELAGMALAVDAAALDGLLASVECALQPWFGSAMRGGAGEPSVLKHPILTGAEDNAGDSARGPGNWVPTAELPPRLPVLAPLADR